MSVPCFCSRTAADKDRSASRRRAVGAQAPFHGHHALADVIVDRARCPRPDVVECVGAFDAIFRLVDACCLQLSLVVAWLSAERIDLPAVIARTCMQ